MTTTEQGAKRERRQCFGVALSCDLFDCVLAMISRQVVSWGDAIFMSCYTCMTKDGTDGSAA